jgi:hypothetical protein
MKISLKFNFNLDIFQCHNNLDLLSNQKINIYFSI